VRDILYGRRKSRRLVKGKIFQGGKPTAAHGHGLVAENLFRKRGLRGPGSGGIAYEGGCSFSIYGNLATVGE